MVCSVQEFLDKIRDAILTPYSSFEEIGLKRGSEWIQISTGRLQIENEYYDSLRPKRVGVSGSRPHEALSSSGIEYVEVRGIDLTPNETIGISKDQIRFLDLMLLFCAITESPFIDDDEISNIEISESDVVSNGNNSSCEVYLNGRYLKISEAKIELTDALKEIAALMPNKDEYYNSLNCIQNKNGILKSLESGKISFADYGLLTSELHSSYLKSIQGLDLSIFEKEARDYFNEKVYSTVIPRNVRLSEAPSHGMPVLIYDKSCLGSKSYFSFTDEFINQEATVGSVA